MANESERSSIVSSRAVALSGAPRVVSDCVAVYLGEQPLQAGPDRVLPLHAFARELAAGRILRSR